MSSSFLGRIISKITPPRPPKEWPQYAHECGWAPKPDNPNYPFNPPPKWQSTYAKVFGAGMWFWLMLRWKEDAAHEIFVSVINDISLHL